MRRDRKFNLKNSLFASWKGNLKQHLYACYDSDFKYSKIYKFIKEPSELDRVNNILKENYTLIFEQYIWGQAMSNYPTVGMNDFTRLSSIWKVIDKSLTISDIDRLFFAVNFEEVQGKQEELEDNPDKELCRYEFFEIIVRMAKEKY